MSDKNEPRRIPAKKPGEAKPTGSNAPSMKERLLAERRAAESGAPPPAPAKPAPAAKPVAARPAPAGKPVSAGNPAPAAKPAGAPKPSGTPSQPAARAGAKPAGARPSTRASRASRAAGGEDGGEGGGRRRPAREPKKRSPVPMIATGVVVIGAAVGGFFYMQGGDPPVEAGNGASAANAAGTGEAGESGDMTVADGSSTDGASTAGDSSGAGEGSSSSDQGSNPSGSAPSSGAQTPPEPEPKATPPAERPEGMLPSNRDLNSWNVIAIRKTEPGDPIEKVNDPSRVDLSKLEPYGPPPGVDSSTWDALVADAKLMFDPDSGVQGTRAEKRLIEAGLNAWPAITNEMMKLDPRRPADNNAGKRADGALDKIRGGTTDQGFNWRMPTVSEGELERKDLFYNLQLIVELHDVWRRHLEAPDRYFVEKIAKGKVQEKMQGSGGDAGEGAGADDDLGDIDFSDLGG
jgi:hypothetical protein